MKYSKSSLPPFILSAFSKIQLSAKDFEEEKIDRQTMQHQLHKVLKELRKARDQIAKLESAVSVTPHHNTPENVPVLNKCARLEPLLFKRRSNLAAEYSITFIHRWSQ